MGIVNKREVPGVGPHNAKIAIIGEAPGASEERFGRPFVGASGHLLDTMLTDAGIKRDDCYIDNVVRIRPPSNRFSALPASVVEEGGKRLRLALHVIKPNVTIALGNPALEALTDVSGISKHRGSIIKGYVGKVVPTFHPAWVLRRWEGKPLVEFDLQRAKEESETPELNLPEPTFITNPSFDLSIKLLKEAEDVEYLSFDIETRRGFALPSCIAFSTEVNHAFCIPFLAEGHPRWSDAEAFKIWAAISELLSSPKSKKIAQNVMFDAYVLHSSLDIDIVHFWQDTMLLHNVIYSELPKSLATLCSLYTRYPYYKDMAHQGGGDEAFWKYNCLDACVTLECALKLYDEAKEFGVWDYYTKYVNPLIWPLLQMQSRGILVDIEARDAASKRVTEIVDDYEATMEDVLGHPLNVNSPKQMKKTLYDELKMPVQKRTVVIDGVSTRVITTDEKALKRLKKKLPDDPILDLVLRTRREKKLLGTYLTIPFDPDGYMRCSYNIAGTKGTRISSSKTAFGTGGNLQNVPPGIARKVLIADPGTILMSGDLSQADARCVAHLAQDEAMIEIFSDDSVDFYTEVAKMVFGTGDARQLTKKIIHASNYGMGPMLLSELAEIPFAEANAALAAYDRTFPRIGVWHLQVENMLRKTRILTTPFGRKRIFFGRYDPRMYRDGYAFVPQSTVANVLHIAIIAAHGCVPDDVDIILHMHDAFTLQCPPERESEMRNMYYHVYDIPVTIHRRTFTIPIKIKVGRTWDDIS